MTKAECIEALYGQALQAEQMVGCARAMEADNNMQLAVIVLLIAGYILGGILAYFGAR